MCFMTAFFLFKLKHPFFHIPPAFCTEMEKNICETNCIDFSFPYCREETIFDCGCREEDERYSGDSCTDKRNCGCYNMNTTTMIPPGEKLTTGCSEWSAHFVTIANFLYFIHCSASVCVHVYGLLCSNLLSFITICFAVDGNPQT